MIAEFILPGLVSVFIGMGALTVAFFLHMGWVDHIVHQLLVWFSSSLIYIFSIRLIVVKVYPTDTGKTDIDEDNAVEGQIVEVTEDIPAEGMGRIKYGDSTWKAWTSDSTEIAAGEKAKIVGRDNITYIVEEA